MKPFPAECVPHALAVVWGASQVVAHTAQSIAPQFVSDEKALSVSLAAGVAAGVVAVCAGRGGVRERVATFFSSLSMAVSFGPLTAHMVMAWLQVPQPLVTQVMIGTSALAGLIGWPLYKLALALFVVSGEHSDGLGGFFGAAIKAFLRKDRSGD